MDLDNSVRRSTILCSYNTNLVNYAYQRKWARLMIAKPPTRARAPAPALELVLEPEASFVSFCLSLPLVVVFVFVLVVSYACNILCWLLHLDASGGYASPKSFSVLYDFVKLRLLHFQSGTFSSLKAFVTEEQDRWTFLV